MTQVNFRPREEPNPPHSLGDRAAGAASAAVGALDADRYTTALRELDRVAMQAMLTTLRAVGLFEGDAECAEPGVAATVGVAPRHRWILRRWLDILTWEGVLAHDGATGRYRVSGSVWQHPPGCRSNIETLCLDLGYPQELAGFFERCNSDLLSLLRDEKMLQEMLFVDGGLDTAKMAYRDNIANSYLNAATAEVLRTAGASVSPRDQFYVVELGAGVGGTSTEVIAALGSLERKIDYLFTDVSPYFLSAARRTFSAHSWVRYDLCDINVHSGRLGSAGSPPDVILSANVLHNAHDIRATLSWLREEVCPGGLVVFIETCREHYQLLNSMQFMISVKPGHRYPGCADQRAGSGRVCLSRSEWLDELRRSGLCPLLVLPDDEHPLAAFAQHVFVARASG